MSDDKLKPCPFCGGEDIRAWPHDIDPDYSTEYEWSMACEGCDAETGYHNTKAEAIAAWNRRVK